MSRPKNYSYHKMDTVEVSMMEGRRSMCAEFPFHGRRL